MSNWIFSKRWRYAHYETYTKKRWSAFHIGLGRWRANETPNVIKDRVHILPFFDFYFNTSEFFVSIGWLVLEIYFYTKNFEKYEKMIRRTAESR